MATKKKSEALTMGAFIQKLEDCLDQALSAALQAEDPLAMAKNVGMPAAMHSALIGANRVPK